MSHIKTIRIEIGKKNLGFRNLEEKLEKVCSRFRANIYFHDEILKRLSLLLCHYIQ
jgi:hypothetical protein